MEPDSSQSQPTTGRQPWLARNWHRPRGFAALLALFVIAANHQVVFGDETFVLRDFSLFGYPLALHVKASLLAGEFPLWSPYNECGHPFLAHWNTMALYPPGWLLLALPLSWALAVFCLAHQYLGGLGMYFLARSWTRNSHGACLAGIIFAFNGITQTSLMWPNNSCALGWLPWVMLAVHYAWRHGGRSVAVASLVSGLQMLTGAPEIILFTWIMLTCFLLGDLIAGLRRKDGRTVRSLLRFVTIVIATTFLAAAQLIPFFDLMLQSPRFRAGEELEWFIRWYGWANYFIPYFENIGAQPSGVIFQASQFWTHSYYVGLVPWLLLLPALARNRARRPWILLAGSAFALVLAMGPDGHLYTLLDRVLPFEVMRYPVKFLVICCVTLPLLAAYGVRRMSIPRISDFNVQSVVVVVLVFAAAALLMDNVKLPERGRDLGAENIKYQAVWLIVFSAALLFWPRFRKHQRSYFLLGICVLLAADLKWHQTSLSPSIPRKLYEEPHPLQEIMESARYPHGRVLPSMATQSYNLYRKSGEMKKAFYEDRAGQFANINLIGRHAQVDGFFSVSLPHFYDIFWKFYDGRFNYHEKLADFAGITHVNTDKSPHDWKIRSTAQPLITAGRRPIFVDPTNVVDRLVSPEFDPAQIVYLHQGTESLVPTNAVPAAQVADVEFSPHKIAFRVTSPDDTIVTIAQSHYHWWQAEVDGRPTPIHFANGAFQAIVVPAGDRHVTLRYVDQGFRLGAVLSLSALLACLLGAFGPRFNQK